MNFFLFLIVKGIVQVEIDIEKHIIKELKIAVKAIKIGGFENMRTARQKLTIANIEVNKLENLEYHENATIQWKRWEEKELREVKVSIMTTFMAITAVQADVDQSTGRWKNYKDAPFLIKKQEAINRITKAIAILKKLEKYELRIGG